MGARRIKVQKSNRSVLIKGDDNLGVSERFNAWLQLYSRWVMGGVLAAVLVALVVWGVHTYQGYREARAQQEYALLSEKWPSADVQQPEKWQEYIKSSQEFIQKYGSTRVGLNAELDLSRAFFQTGQYDESARWAQKVLDERDDQLQFLARYQLAMAYEALGKPDQAVSLLGAGSTVAGSGFDREMHWHLARHYAGQKEYAKAVEQYEQALKSDGRYPQDAMIQSELSSARAKAGSGAGAADKKS